MAVPCTATRAPYSSRRTTGRRRDAGGTSTTAKRNKRATGDETRLDAPLSRAACPSVTMAHGRETGKAGRGCGRSMEEESEGEGEGAARRSSRDSVLRTQSRRVASNVTRLARVHSRRLLARTADGEADADAVLAQRSSNERHAVLSAPHAGLCAIASALQFGECAPSCRLSKLLVNPHLIEQVHGGGWMLHHGCTLLDRPRHGLGGSTQGDDEQAADDGAGADHAADDGPADDDADDADDEAAATGASAFDSAAAGASIEGVAVAEASARSCAFLASVSSLRPWHRCAQ